MDIRTALNILEVPPSASGEEALKAYKDLIRVWHPDNFVAKPDLLDRATAKTKLLNEAWKACSAILDEKAAPVRVPRRVSLPPWLKSLLIFAGTLLFLGSLTGLVIVSDVLNPELGLEKALVERAWAANKSLPVVLDEDTKLTAVFSGPGRRFTYVYQVMNYTKDQVGQSYFDVVRQGLKDGFQTTLRKDRNLRFFSENNVILNYAFKDKTGADILTLEIKPEEYQSF